jgi:glycerol transport system ATP-binding protein
LTGHLADLADGSYRFAFRSNNLWLSSQTDGDLAISGTVELAEINGSETFIYVHHGKSAFVVQQEGVHHFAMGNEIKVFINPEHLFVYGTAGQLVAAPPAAGLSRIAIAWRTSWRA